MVEYVLKILQFKESDFTPVCLNDKLTLFNGGCYISGVNWEKSEFESPLNWKHC